MALLCLNCWSSNQFSMELLFHLELATSERCLRLNFSDMTPKLCVVSTLLGDGLGPDSNIQKKSPGTKVFYVGYGSKLR